MPLRATSLVFLALLYAPAAPAQITTLQDGPPPTGPVSAAERAAVVERISARLADRYVFAEKGREAGAYIRKQLDAGAYAAEPDSFALALTRDLQHVTRDKHIRVRLAPPRDAGPSDPIRERADWQESLREGNLGIRSVEVIDGNIGYLDLRFFPPEEEVREAYDAAMRLLGNVDALIVDERRHGGGSPSGIRYLTSYFFETPTHINSLHWRDGDAERVEEFWTFDRIGGARRPDLPIFVLTSDYTFSGAEEFANNLKELDRATIVGETTGGGANPGGMFPAGRFGIFIPEGRAVNPISGTNWEGVGVEPDVEVPAEEALDKALELARPAAEVYQAARQERIDARIDAFHTGMDESVAAFTAGRDATAQVRGTLHAALNADLIDEQTINALGYEHLQTRDTTAAIAIFRFNAEAFPESWNVHDSLAEALAAQGEHDAAARLYRRARALAPDDQHERIDAALSEL